MEGGKPNLDPLPSNTTTARTSPNHHHRKNTSPTTARTPPNHYHRNNHAPITKFSTSRRGFEEMGFVGVGLWVVLVRERWFWRRERNEFVGLERGREGREIWGWGRPWKTVGRRKETVEKEMEKT
jgi:hypothetical protein